MTLTLTLTLTLPCEILDVEILDACADSPIVINFASGEFRATPGWILAQIDHFRVKFDPPPPRVSRVLLHSGTK